MNFIPHKLFVKSVQAVHGRLQKLVMNNGAYNEFKLILINAHIEF